MRNEKLRTYGIWKEFCLPLYPVDKPEPGPPSGNFQPLFCKLYKFRRSSGILDWFWVRYMGKFRIWIAVAAFCVGGFALPLPQTNWYLAPAAATSGFSLPRFQPPSPRLTPGWQGLQQAKDQGKTIKQKKKTAVPVAGSAYGMHGTPKHIFYIIPAYNVVYGEAFKPMTPHEKYEEWLEGTYDWIGLAAGATEAALEHSKTDGFCGYGSGLDSFGKCYASALADSTISSFLGDYLFSVWLHQDPRYFRLGQGSIAGRAWYALERSVMVYNDKGQTVFGTAAMAGTLIAAATSNLYYPKQDRGLNLTLSRIAWDLGGTVIFNEEAEFWPDIRHGLGKIF